MSSDARKGLGIMMMLIFGGLFLLWGGSRIKAKIDLGRKCTGHLKRAADASTVELAKIELDTAIEYIEDHDLTEGSTGILWDTPAIDVGFWYKNIKSAAKELGELPEETTRLERTNVLMKLRETLLDAGERGSMEVTYPGGLSVFPENSLYCWWAVFSCILAICGFGIFLTADPY